MSASRSATIGGACRRRWASTVRNLVVFGFLLIVAGPVRAQPSEYVITFDGVTVRGIGGIYDAPEVAHLDPAGLEKGSSPAGSPRATQPLPERPLPAPVSSLALAPGEGTKNPSFVQHGFLVEAFWAVRIGSPFGYFKRAHFHPPDLSTGFEAQHLGNPDEVHGVYIRALDGKPFGLRSLRYRVTRNRQIPRKPFSLEGFNNYDVNVLLGRSFDPRQTIRAQFLACPVGLPFGNDPTLPWWTLPISGFEIVTQVFIASSASVDFDAIVLTRGGGE